MANALLSHNQVCWRPERKGLISLNLTGNGFGDVGLHHLAAFLRFNRSLIRLNLSQNNISDDGIETLGRQVLLKFPLSRREIVSMRIKRVKWLHDMLHGSSEQQQQAGKPAKRHQHQQQQVQRPRPRIAVRLGKRGNRNGRRTITNPATANVDGGGLIEGGGRATTTMAAIREEPSKLITNAVAKKTVGGGNAALAIPRSGTVDGAASANLLSAPGTASAQQSVSTGGNIGGGGSVAGVGKGKVAAGSGKNTAAAGGVASLGGAANFNAGAGIGGKSLAGSDEASTNQLGDLSANAATPRQRDFYTTLRQKMYDMSMAQQQNQQQQQQQQQALPNASGGGAGVVGGDGQLMLDDYFDPLVHGNSQRMADGSVWLTGNRVLSYLNLSGKLISRLQKARSSVRHIKCSWSSLAGLT